MNGTKGAEAGSPNGPNGQEKSTNPNENDGLWLCEKGPYQQYIAALSDSNPGLKQPDPMNKNDYPLKPGNATVVLLEQSQQGESNFNKTQFKHSADLKKHFDNTNDAHSSRRIYIMEGLAQDYVSVIGNHFFMDPIFFLRQERTCVWSNDFTPTSDALPQPTLLDPNKSFHLQYCELRQFHQLVPNDPFFCSRTGRHVGMTPARLKEKSTTGILRRKTSFWNRKTTGGGWDVVILCDPQLYTISRRGAKQEYTNGPFGTGYIDFLPAPDRERALTKPRHPHDCMLRDLVHYFEHHSDLLGEEMWEDPTTAAIFLKKIVAAHYLQLVDYIKVMLPSLELRLTTAWVEEQDQWKSLQTISRRCGNYRDDIEDTLLSLRYPLKDIDSPKPTDWKDCEKDFQYIYFRLKILKQRADTLMQAMTGLASIAGNRQNLEEAKRVKRLNLLALLFIPLAYTSSLFSMSDGFTPGDAKFWIYWVSSIPVIAFTFLATWLMGTALDDAAQWRVQWRALKFWDPDRKPHLPKRKKTGLY